MDIRARIVAVAVLALAAAACYTPSLKTPTLSALTADEKTMDCAQLDLALDRADTVRWLIRDDGGRLETPAQRMARYAGNLIFVPVVAYVGHTLGYIESGHDELDAADGRIRELLQQKRSHECPHRPTAIADMDDAALLRELESIQAKLDAGGDEAPLFEERMRLLDNLRVVPAPAAGKEVR
jgi:hypothetical protein